MALSPTLGNKGTVSEFSLEPSEPRVVQTFSESSSYVPFPVAGLSEERKSSAARLCGLLCINLSGRGEYKNVSCS